MRIHETRQYDFSRAVDLGNTLAVLLSPRIAQRVFRLAPGNNLPANAQHRAVFDNAKVAKTLSAPWPGSSHRR